MDHPIERASGSSRRINFLGAASLLLAVLLPQFGSAADLPPWQLALAKMDLPAESIPLQRSNVLRHILRAFRSNDTVKAVIVLPGVADDLYLVHRDAPPLNLEAPNLLEALIGFTNRTGLGLTFRDPFLLLHATRPGPKLNEPRADRTKTRDQLTGSPTGSVMLWEDVHWAQLQPVLRRALSLTIKPAPSSEDAWHFERVNLAGCNLTRWELLTVAGWTTGAKVSIGKRTASFARDSAH